MPRLVRRIGAALTVLAIPLALGSPSAAADNVSRWSISASSGYMSGQFTSNPLDDYYHVSGTLKDNKAGDSCTLGQIWAGANLVWSYSQCGGGSRTFDVQGFTSAPYVWLRVCKQSFPQSCGDKNLYL